MLLIANQPIDTTAQASLSGDLIVLAGNLFASLGYVAGGRLQREGYPSTGTTFWGAGLAAVILLPTLPFIVDDIVFAEIAPASLLGVLYLAIGVTIVGYVLWYWALGKGGIERIGLIQFLQPISGVILAWLLLGERVDFGFVLASGMVLVGVWVAIQAKDKA